VQFLRMKAKEWNLDPKRFALSGNSAGAGISLWLAFHDDMADPTDKDPIARESTRLWCAAVESPLIDTRFRPRGASGRHRRFLHRRLERRRPCAALGAACCRRADVCEHGRRQSHGEAEGGEWRARVRAVSTAWR
jgi:hypothetical protein